MPKKSPESLVAVFTDPNDALHATDKVREEGFEIVDVYTPFPVHGMDDAMGLKRSKITWVTFIAGMSGAAIALLGQIFVNWDYPIVIGGKQPVYPIPAFIPITFELTVLIGGLTTVAALFHLGKFIPFKTPKLVAEGITDDRFALEIKRTAVFDREKAEKICNDNNAEWVYDFPPEDVEYEPHGPVSIFDRKCEKKEVDDEIADDASENEEGSEKEAETVSVAAESDRDESSSAASSESEEDKQ